MERNADCSENVASMYKPVPDGAGTFPERHRQGDRNKRGKLHPNFGRFILLFAKTLFKEVLGARGIVHELGKSDERGEASHKRV